MKKIIYFFLGCAVIGFIASLVLSTLPAFEMAGTSVLRTLKEGNYQQAYTLFSPDLQSRFPLENVSLFANEYNLKDFKEVKWLKSITDPNKRAGYIIGDMKIGDKTVPIELHFVKIKSSTLAGSTWYLDDVFVGPDVIKRQSKVLNNDTQSDPAVK